jgi:hypothetical protein
MRATTYDNKIQGGFGYEEVENCRWNTYAYYEC